MQPFPHQDEFGLVHAYLVKVYAGVFTAEAIQTHIRDYVGFTFAEQACRLLAPHLPAGAFVLDIGAGFGSCVLRARNAGFSARGIEPSAFEVDYARRRLARLRPQDDPDHVYQIGRVEELALCHERFDAITLWNVLEHIPNTPRTLQTCYKLLRPGGCLFIICPNYCAWRDEAHYHVPWSPLNLLFKNRFLSKLKAAGRNPEYYRNGIIPVTNWGVLRTLRRCGFALHDLSGNCMPFRLPLNPYLVQKRIRFWSPFVPSVLVLARKPSGSL